MGWEGGFMLLNTFCTLAHPKVHTTTSKQAFMHVAAVKTRIWGTWTTRNTEQNQLRWSIVSRKIQFGSFLLKFIGSILWIMNSTFWKFGHFSNPLLCSYVLYINHVDRWGGGGVSQMNISTTLNINLKVVCVCSVFLLLHSAYSCYLLLGKSQYILIYQINFV